MLEKGTIKDFNGNWGSGIATLIILDSKGHIQNIHCENPTTVRALESAFGNVITEGHTVNCNSFIGKEIYFSVDNIGLLEVFTPVEEASEEFVEEFEKGK